MGGSKNRVGRGIPLNPANHYERIHIAPEPDESVAAGAAGEAPTPLYRDRSRAIPAENDSPDISFRFRCQSVRRLSDRARRQLPHGLEHGFD